MSVSNDEEGFEEKMMFEVSQEIIRIVAPETVYKKKAILRSPRCIFPKVSLFRYPSWLDLMPKNYQLEGSLVLEHYPLQKVLPYPDAESNLNELAKKYFCLYNKFNENLASKRDMTIFLQNVRAAVSLEMMRPFDKNVLDFKSRAMERWSLAFESRYESGNLHSVFIERSRKDVFYLCLQNDTNTHGYSQWFNFMVKPNPFNFDDKKQFQARFLIINHSKEIKYDQSLRILTCQEVNGQVQWASNVPFLYYKNKYLRYKKDFHSTIDFKYTFSKPSPIIFCLSLPYTYTKLLDFLNRIRGKTFQRLETEIEQIGKSQGANRIYLLKVLHKNNYRDKGVKRCVIVTARQHASESVSSILCEKIIRNVLERNNGGEIDWFFIPMINPDGVIHGNSRSSLKGYDINRCWEKSSLHLSSEAECINQWIQNMRKEYKIELIWDLHGHTKEFDAFAYFAEKSNTSKCINCLLSEKTHIYNFSKSRFGISYKKRPTFRGQMYYRMHIKNAITLQVSHFGLLKGSKVVPMVDQDFMSLAEAFVETVYEVFTISQEKEQKILSQEKEMQKLIFVGKKEEEESNKDSDSDPEGDYLLLEERENIGEKFEDLPPKNTIQFLRKEQPEKPDEEGKEFATFYGRQRRLRSEGQLQTHKDKDKDQRIKRKKPIYTSSYVEITPYSNGVNKQSKRYSIDQNHDVLESKKRRTEEKERVNRIKSVEGKRMMNTESNLNASLQRFRSLGMKSKPMVVFPTASNIKINISQITGAEREELISYKSQSAFNLTGSSFRERIRAKAPKNNFRTNQKLNFENLSKTFLSIGPRKQ